MASATEKSTAAPACGETNPTVSVPSAANAATPVVSEAAHRALVPASSCRDSAVDAGSMPCVRSRPERRRTPIEPSNESAHVRAFATSQRTGSRIPTDVRDRFSPRFSCSAAISIPSRKAVPICFSQDTRTAGSPRPTATCCPRSTSAACAPESAMRTAAEVIDNVLLIMPSCQLSLMASPGADIAAPLAPKAPARERAPRNRLGPRVVPSVSPLLRFTALRLERKVLLYLGLPHLLHLLVEPLLGVRLRLRRRDLAQIRVAEAPGIERGVREVIGAVRVLFALGRTVIPDQAGVFVQQRLAPLGIDLDPALDELPVHDLLRAIARQGDVETARSRGLVGLLIQVKPRAVALAAAPGQELQHLLVGFGVQARLEVVQRRLQFLLDRDLHPLAVAARRTPLQAPGCRAPVGGRLLRDQGHVASLRLALRFLHRLHQLLVSAAFLLPPEPQPTVQRGLVHAGSRRRRVQVVACTKEVADLLRGRLVQLGLPTTASGSFLGSARQSGRKNPAHAEPPSSCAEGPMVGPSSFCSVTHRSPSPGSAPSAAGLRRNTWDPTRPAAPCGRYAQPR